MEKPESWIDRQARKDGSGDSYQGAHVGSELRPCTFCDVYFLEVLRRLTQVSSWVLSGFCPFSCAALPSGPAVCLCDIFMLRTAVTPQPHWLVCTHWALTLSLVILSQKGCWQNCAGKLSSFSLRRVGSLQSSWSDLFSGHTRLCSLWFFSLCSLLVDDYYSSVTLLMGQFCWGRTVVSKPLLMFLICLFFASYLPHLLATLCHLSALMKQKESADKV